MSSLFNRYLHIYLEEMNINAIEVLGLSYGTRFRSIAKTVCYSDGRFNLK